MTWTNDAPTKAGLYRLRRNPADSLRMAVDVVEPLSGSNVLLAYWCGQEGHEFVALWEMRQRFPHCQWSSTPIPEPEEAR
jgi:hypothetical protein